MHDHMLPVSQALIASRPDLVTQSVPDLSSGGQLPLHLAASSGAVEVLRLLLTAGADVTARNGSGETALQVKPCQGGPPSLESSG